MIRNGNDQLMAEKAKDQAIAREGKKFISLRLIDTTKNRIQGAIVLHATPYMDQMTNLNKFHFEERGGPVDFKPNDFKGGLYCNMLDCEHNRKFLASMYTSGFWEIEDEGIEAQIKEMAAEIRNKMLAVKPINVSHEKDMTSHQLSQEMARIQKEISRRGLVENTNEPVQEQKEQGNNIEKSPESKEPDKPRRGRRKLVTVE